MDWATIEMVEAHLGFASDARMETALATSLAWCHRKRPDLDPASPVHADIAHAVVIYAGLLYRERSQGGTVGYDEMGNMTGSDATSYARVLDLLGVRKPKAR
jgi:hypothetical protein